MRERTGIYEDLISEVSELKAIVIQGEYNKDEDEYGPAKTYYFKKFSNAKFEGTRDEQIAFSKRSQDFIQRKIPEFVQAWSDGIDEVVHKLEYSMNNIELIRYIQEAEEATKKETLSFRYEKLSTNPTALSDVYIALKRNNFIDNSTTLTNFKKVFSGKEILTPIIWTGNISELHYFIMCFHNLKKKVENTNNRHWKIAVHCFIQPNNKPFTVQQLHDAKKPSTFRKIDSIVANLD